MYAIVETGGKQYRIEKNNRILVEKIPVDPGQEIILDKVLMISGEDGSEIKIGTPYVEGASVKAEVDDQTRGPKIKVFKRRRRKDSKTMHGHRQDYTVLLIKEIIAEA